MLLRNMEKKDFDIHKVEEVISFIGCEEMTMATLNVKEEMCSEESSEVNVCAPDNTIDSVLINSNETISYPLKEEGQECMNDSETSFCFVGIKMEEPDDYESKASFTNSETKYSSVQYPSNLERQCNIDGQCLEGKLPKKLSNTSCIKVKMECEEDFANCKSDFQTNDSSVSIVVNNKNDSRSVVRGCDMGHSSNEFIRGTECQEYPILRVKEERKTTDKKIPVNNRNSVQIAEQQKQYDLTCSASADLEYNAEEYPYNRDFTSEEGNVMEENNIRTESSREMQCEEEIDVLDSEAKDSNDGKSRYIDEEVQEDPERNVVQIYPNTTFDESLVNNQCVDRTEGLKIQFESICDVSEFDIKVEKPFGSDLGSENAGELDNKPSILQPLSVILKDEPLELNVLTENQLTKNSSDFFNSSRLMLKEARIVQKGRSSQGVSLLHQTKIGKQASGFRENLISLGMQEPNGKDKEFNDITEDPETSSSAESVEEFSSEQNYEIKYHSSGQREFSCNICEEVFDESRNLEQHSLVHSNDQHISCCTCGKFFTKKESFEEHTCSHGTKESYQDGVSKSSFASKGSLQSHMRNLSDDKRFSCDVCRASFKQKGTLTRHKLTHTGEKHFACDVCTACFKRKDDLTTHMCTHTVEKLFTCVICEASFKLRKHLSGHMVTHTDAKPFSCDVCNACFRRKSHLITHMVTHSDVKPFSCGVCHATFKQKGHLTMHMVTHSDMKQFSCDVCNSSFSRKCYLKLHKVTHSEEKPFSCVICKVSFKRKSHLNTHMLTHTGEKSIFCCVCKASFTCRSSVQRHMQSFH